MLGSQLSRELARRGDTAAAVRGPSGEIGAAERLEVVSNVDAFDSRSVAHALDCAKASVAVNCIGVVKQLIKAQDAATCIHTNSLFPHQLYELCRQRNIRLIHVSTDCVFSGKKGGYTEADPPDAEDLYGRSKLLGEVTKPGALTLRTSFFGPEIKNHTGLLDWFLASKGIVHGYTNAIFSGFTSFALARLIGEIIYKNPDLSGLYHLSSSPISKFDLLSRIREGLNLDTRIEPYSDFHCDRSLDSSRIRKDASLGIPSWNEMIEELCAKLQETSDEQAVRS